MDSVTYVKDKNFQTRVKKRLGEVIVCKCKVKGS